MLRSRVQTNDATEESDKQWRAELSVAVKDSSLKLKVVLGQLGLSLAEFENMQEGDVLHFKKPDFARVLVNDVPIFDGQVGNLGAQTAVRMEQPICMQQVPDMQRRTSNE